MAPRLLVLKVRLMLTYLILFYLSSLNVFAADETLLKQYQDYLKKYSVPVVDMKCADLDFKTKSPLRRFKTNISRSNAQISKPNFAGKYLLLENPISMGSGWELASCETGKYLKSFPSIGTLIFSPDSSVAITYTFGSTDTIKTFYLTVYGYPEIYEWNGKTFIHHKNPIQPHTR